jgi:hypothetical protein
VEEMSVILNHKELVKVGLWAKNFFTEDYLFSIEGTNQEPILVARLPLPNGGIGVEKYLISDILPLDRWA